MAQGAGPYGFAADGGRLKVNGGSGFPAAIDFSRAATIAAGKPLPRNFTTFFAYLASNTR